MHTPQGGIFPLGENMTKAEFVKALKEKSGLATLAQAEAAYEKLFAITA